jgi:hypothetical protein
MFSVIAATALISTRGAAAGKLQQYANVGIYNATTYSFTAQSTGDLKAYFSGASAAYESQIGLLVNGVSTGVFGLDNQRSKIGQSLDFGQVTVGESLTFVLKILTLGAKEIYSAPSMNTAYDPSMAGGANHIFSSAYDGADSSLAGIPAGTFVGFEDLPVAHSDLDYNDETFVFTNVAAAASAPPVATGSTPPTTTPPTGLPPGTTTPPGSTPAPPGQPPVTPPSAVPEPATWAVMLLGFGVIGGALRHRAARTARGRSPVIENPNVFRI